MSYRIFKLPCYGIEVRVNGSTGGISSDLHEKDPPPLIQLAEDAEDAENRALYNAAMDAIESMILAHACAGVNVSMAAYVEGIESAVQAIGAAFA